MSKLREKLAEILRNRFTAAPSQLLKQIDAAAAETELDPSDEQREAGNYRKGKFRLHGLEIAIENPRGSERRSKADAPKPWSVTMSSHYGYIKKHISEADGDHVDVFVGPHPESQFVAVVDQAFGEKFDEHKVMLGYRNAAEAKAAYFASYSPGWQGFRAITPLTMDQFKGWLENGDTSQPMAQQAIKYAKHKSAPGQADLFADTDAVASKGGQEKGKWTQTQLGTQEFEKKHPRDRDGRFTKKVGQANLMLWGADGDPTPESQGAPQQSGKIIAAAAIDKDKAHDIHVDARAHATHTLQKKLHSLGLAKEAPKHPEPVNTAELKQAAGFGDDEGLLLFRHGNMLRAHGEDAKKLAEVNGGNSHITADSLEQIGAALRERGHKLAIASKPGSQKQQSLLDSPATAPKPAEPPKTPAQEIGATAGKEMAAKLADKPLPAKSPLSKFLPGKNSEYPKPGEAASNGQTAATQANPLQPTPVAPPAPPQAPAAPPATPIQPPAQQPTQPAMTEAEQERAERAAMELARPAPGAAAKTKPAAAKPPRESKNDLTDDDFSRLLSESDRLIEWAVRKNGLPDHLAMEAANTARMQAWEAFRSFDPNEARFSTWIEKIAENAAGMKHREEFGTLKRGKGKTKVSMSAPVGSGGDSGETATFGDSVADYRESYDPEQQEEMDRQRRIVKQAFHKLSMKQQEVFDLLHQGYSSEEIGKRLGKTRVAVESLRDRAALMIRKIAGLDSSGEESPSLFNPPKKYQRDKRESVICQENRTLVQLLIDVIRERQAQ